MRWEFQQLAISREHLHIALCYDCPIAIIVVKIIHELQVDIMNYSYNSSKFQIGFLFYFNLICFIC